MVPDKVIYTDGHDITVTDSEFQVKKKTYRLDGIIKYGLLSLSPERVPSFILMALGLTIALVGALELIYPTTVSDVLIGDRYVSANTLALWIGAALFLIGLIVLAIIRQRYAVRISTAEGEKNAVVSHNKEYIAQIVDALTEARRKVVHIPY